MGLGWLLSHEVVDFPVILHHSTFLTKCRFNDGDAPAPQGKAIGDKLNNLTGGRMGWLVDGARKKQDDKHTGVDQTPRTHGSESDSAPRKLQTNGHANANGHTDGGKVKKPAKLAAKHDESGQSSATESADGAQERKSAVAATSAPGAA
jgi:hypothetical protein